MVRAGWRARGIRVGAAEGAFAAMAGYDLTGQLIAASLVGVLGVIVLRQLRRAKTIIEEQVGQLDLGAQVHVDAWDANGTSQVKHRGPFGLLRWPRAKPP